MKPIFNVPGCGAYAMLMGIISGYPIGAKIVTNFRENGMCSKEECERLLAFTNNSGPLFIIGTVGISMFYNSLIGVLLFITHLLACLTVGFIFRFWKREKVDLAYKSPKVRPLQRRIYSTSIQEQDRLSMYNNRNIDSRPAPTYKNDYSNVSFSNLGEVLSKAISSATSTILMIGGFVVLFSVILSILENSNFISALSSALEPIFNMFGITNNSFVSGFVSGIIELTNGVQKITAIPCREISTNIILSALLLGFGGISILLQVFSITSKTDISIKPYIIGKILHGILAAFYTYIFISYFPIFNLNI